MTPPRHAKKCAFLALQNVAHFVNSWTRMRLWLAASSVILAGACVAETHRGGRQDPDAAVGDDAACATPQTFFEDHDGDGHGDMALSVQACTQPAGTVTIGDDCDDADATRHPGATDLCDGIDNDCDAATAEICPTGCTAARRPPPDEQHIYLFCTAATNWVAASANCATATGFNLAEIDSQAENDFIRTTANNLLGNVNIHIGANDRAVENSWVWDGGELF